MPQSLVTQCCLGCHESPGPVRPNLCPASELYFHVSCLVTCILTEWLRQWLQILLNSVSWALLPYQGPPPFPSPAHPSSTSLKTLPGSYQKVHLLISPASAYLPFLPQGFSKSSPLPSFLTWELVPTAFSAVDTTAFSRVLCGPVYFPFYSYSALRTSKTLLIFMTFLTTGYKFYFCSCWKEKSNSLGSEACAFESHLPTSGLTFGYFLVTLSEDSSSVKWGC